MSNTQSPKQSLLKECHLHWQHLNSINVGRILKEKTWFIIDIPIQYPRDSYFARLLVMAIIMTYKYLCEKKKKNNPK